MRRDVGGKASELSSPTPTAVTVTAVAKFLHRVASPPSTAPEDDAAALLKSFRRKKQLRARLLRPLPSDDPLPPKSPRRQGMPKPPPMILTSETQQKLAQLDAPNNRTEDTDEETTSLARVQALLASPDEIDRWIATYETEKAMFTSFALCTEMKLDEIHERYVPAAGRPNAVEAAACCATLFKMPGIVGCYKTLLEKLAVGVLSVVYQPDTKSMQMSDDVPMAALVRQFFGRKPYFERTQELEQQLRDAKYLTDATVLGALTVDEISDMVLHIPVRTMCQGIVHAYSRHLPHLDHLLALLHEKKLQLQLEFYQLHGRRRRGLAKRASGAHGDEEEEDEDDPDYPMSIPLTSSAQICRAITQHAATFSSSGKEMILCSILEHIEVDSFKDVFKRFDAHGKTCFLHHLSVLESSDHLQFILEELPNPGEMLFRFYYVLCSGGGSGRLEASGRIDPKHVFFQKVLGADIEFFFLCDLAAYLNDEQWTLLSQEYEKHAQARKARRGRIRRQLNGENDGEDDENEDQVDENDENDDLHRKKTVSGSIEQFQTMIWNYVHHHKFTSAQIWRLLHAVLLPSLEEVEFIQCLDYCMEHFTLGNRWERLVAMVDEMDADSTSTGDDSVHTDLEMVRLARLKMLKKILAMLTREDRLAWLEKVAAKDGLVMAKPQPPPPRKEPTVAPVVQTPPPKPLTLEDPKTYVAQMRLDTKMLWLETLLHAVANDKETSARTAMLKQSLLPFLNGHTPVPTPTPAVHPHDTTTTLTDAENAIQSILQQLRYKNPTDEAALWAKIIPDHLRPKMIAKSDRAVSPIPVRIPLSSPPEPAKPVVRGWWEVAGPDSDIAKAFRTLVETKPEAEVLELLRRGEVPKPTVSLGDEDEASDDRPLSSTRFNAIKRKLSAVIAVSEPMEWQEFVKVGMLDQGTQTEEPETPIVDPPSDVVARAPLTLTTLLGRAPNDKASISATPRRKGEVKFQKLNNSAVPRSISGLITSWRVNTDQLTQFAKKSMPTVLRLIADAYGELLTAGRRKAVAANAATVAGGRGVGKELTLAQIVYQQFLHSYGLPGIADMHLLALSCALEAYRSQHWRVEFFSRFVFEEVSKLELTNYLDFLECLVCDDLSTSNTNANANSTTTSPNTSSTTTPAQGPATTKRQRFVPRIVVSDKENWLVPLEKAQEAAQLCFRAMRKQAVTMFCDRLAQIATQGTGGYVPVSNPNTTIPSSTLTPAIALSEAGRTSPTGVPTTVPTSNATADGLMLNVDFLLKLVVKEWQEEQLRREAHLLNVFRAGDVNGDGELTSAEFTQIVLAIDHTRDLDDILLMYSETLRRTQSDAIDAENFLQVAKEYELDRAAWNEEGDLRNIVNDMNELEATWSHTRPFFLGTLEALVRDLPTVHFLRVCEGAGCGCLKCILDGYIGFQRMRRDFATSANPRVAMLPGGSRRSSAVSEALLWARFWHLMRQLYEATSESPGILTAWEGANYMRIEPAPRPPPRFLKYRRLAVPNFLFPDTSRISAKMSTQHVELPEVFDRETIMQQFAGLLELMTFTFGSSKATALAALENAMLQ